MRYADDLAYVHHTGFADLARGAATHLVELLASRGIVGGRVVDLGCGSGLVLRALLDAGHRARGVDLSPSMVKLARKIAPGADVIEGSLYDVESWRGEHALHAVFALGEALTYIEPSGRAPALAPFFKKVARTLAPDGLFVFDVIVGGPGRSLTRRSFVEGDDWACLVDTREDDTRTKLTRTITTFVLEGRPSASWRHSHEVHHARVLRTAEVRAALEDAGFRVRVTSSYGAHPLAVRRRAFVCRRGR
jgi:SAM-dependent methyltransferase